MGQGTADKDILFKLSEAGAAEGLSLLSAEGAASAPVLSVCIDSRAAGPGSLFVALPGERVDGHDFVSQAAASGACAALVSRAGWAARSGSYEDLRQKGLSFILAEDSLSGFQALAAWYLSRFPRLLRIGITGSSGKTTTKEMVSSILSRDFQVVSNEGNLNSETGLPLSLFRVRGHHEAGVFELGMNHKGEMAGIARTLSPELVLVTNIGTAHIGILGSREAIALEKRMAFSAFDGRQTAFVHEEEPFLPFLSEGLRGTMRTYGARSTRGFGGARSLGLDGTAVDWEGSRFRLPLPGPHNLRNALGAISLCLQAGSRSESIGPGLEALAPSYGRGQIVRGAVTLFRDCYNANPESLDAALDFLDEVEWAGGDKVYCIGSMYELGESSAAAHQAAGRRLASCAAASLLLFGREMEEAAAAARDAGFKGKLFWTEDEDAYAAELARCVKRGDLVLLKGSRGTRMERFERLLPQGDA